MEWQTVSLPLLGGVDTKSDSRALQPPKLAVAENAVFEKRGSLRKRNGSTPLPRVMADGTADISEGRALFTRDQELLMSDGERLLSYAENASKWDDRGYFVPLTIEAKPIMETASNQFAPDYAEAGGIGVWAWETTGGAVRFSIVDTATKQLRFHDEEIDGSARAPRCVAIDGFVLILYAVPQDGNHTLHAKVIQPQNLSTSVASNYITVASDLRDTLAYDVVVYGSSARLIYSCAFAVSVKVQRLAKTGAVSNIQELETDSAATCVAIGVAPPEQRRCCVAVVGMIDRVSVAYADPDALTFEAFEDQVVDDVYRVAISSSAVGVALDEDGDPESSEHTFSIWVEVAPDYDPEDPGAMDDTLRYVEIYGFSAYLTFSGSLHYTIKKAAIASNGFRAGRYGYCLLTYPGEIQPTYFLYRHDSVMCGRFLAGEAGPLPQGFGLAVIPTPKLSGSEWVFAGVMRQALETEPTVNASGAVTGLNIVRADYGLARVVLDFEAPMMGTEVGRSLYLTGGMLWNYDGLSVTESGFALAPEGASAVASNGSGALTSTGITVAYLVLYEFINVQGEREQSWGLPMVVTLASGDDTVTLDIPTLTHTLKGSDVSITVWRSDDNPTFEAPLYRVSNPDSGDTSGANCYVANDTTADVVSFVDEMSRADLITKELCYTNTGELFNVAPKSPSVICHADDRIYLAEKGSVDTVFPSKLHFDGSCVAFSDEFDPIKVDRHGGEITGVAVLNDNLIVFKGSRIFSVLGAGPDNLGTGFFSPAQLVVSDCGCIDARTIAVIPDGVVFQSAKGFYLLNQGLRVEYIGADVERYNGQAFVSASLLADKNQVRFVTSDGKSLLYDYFWKQWSTWSNFEGVSACLWQGSRYCRLGSTGKVYEESTGFDDAGASIRRIVETAWIKNPFSAQGYMRVRHMELLGEYKSPHRMRVTVFFSYEPGLGSYSFEWDPADALDIAAYGDGDYGDGAYGGSGSAVYQLRHQLRLQKCQAVKFRFEDIPETPPGESCVLTDLMLVVGLKGGGMRLAPTKET